MKTDDVILDPMLLAEEVQSRVLAQAGDCGRQLVLQYQITQPFCMHVDAEPVSQILLNMCRHAILSCTQGDVELTVACDGVARQVLFRIVADMPLVPQDEAERLFDPERRLRCLVGSIKTLTLATSRVEYTLAVAVQAFTALQLEPLESGLSGQGPEFAELVRQFAIKLPTLGAGMALACRNRDWPLLTEMVHNLKGMGGGYGYPQLTDFAVEVENLLENGNHERIAATILNLRFLIRRIVAAVV